uniref:Uncharacterized protein n=1 Tax=Anguilla anguilla TaxID=7936 RepID=A0A0E9XH62_ANGAN
MDILILSWKTLDKDILQRKKLKLTIKFPAVRCIRQLNYVGMYLYI